MALRVVARPTIGNGSMRKTVGSHVPFLLLASTLLTYAEGCATGAAYGTAGGAAIPVADATGIPEAAGAVVGCGIGLLGVKTDLLPPGSPSPDKP